MKVVIQCAAGKRANAGSLHLRDGRQVVFVARPELAPATDAVVHARPDDLAYDGRTWRQHVLQFNEKPGATARGLLPAYQLYRDETFHMLADHFGLPSLFILSAGWGLIPANFRIPLYDITFSTNPKVDTWKRRRRGARFDDFQLMPDAGEPIAFLGGKDYLPLFCTLTAPMKAHKTVFFRQEPNGRCRFVSFRSDFSPSGIAHVGVRPGTTIALAT